MRRWGHTEGAGLGVREDGIKVALAAEHVAKPMDTSKLSKRQRAKQRAAAANAKNRKWTQAANSRGRIVNANEEERQREEHDKFGEASRIICIMGMDDDDAGEELSDEIGEECSRHGWVITLRRF
jgi:splicing factor 45